VAGDVDPGFVLELASRVLVSDRPGAAHRRVPVAEPAAPARDERRLALSVARPNVTLGLKDAAPGVEGKGLLKRETETELLLEVLFGDGGLVEAPLYQEGIVDESLSASYQAEADFGFVAISSDVDAEGPYRERLLTALKDARRRGIGAADLERARRKALGATVRTFNSPERLASALLSLALDGTTFQDTLDAIAATTERSVMDRFDALLACPRAWSVIEPRGDAPPRTR
jgi:predicted Zn-dependent peptidase